MTSPGKSAFRLAAATLAIACASVSAVSAQTYTIKAKAGKGGTIVPSGNVMVTAGADQPFVITPDPGYNITSVLANKVDQGPVGSYTFTNVQAKGSIKVKFKIQTFDLSFSASGGVTIKPSGTATYKYGSSAKITVTPNPGAVGPPTLTVDGSTVPLTPKGKNYSYTLNVTGAHVVVASPAASYSLGVTKDGTGTGTITSSPAGINCGGTCSANFAQGGLVTLTAAAGANSTFDGWNSGGCSGTAPCDITLNADTVVNGTFTSTGGTVQHTLTVNKNGTGSGTVTSTPAGIDCGGTCSALFDDATNVTLTAVADSNSTFTAWNGGGCAGTAPCVVPVTADTVVTATFDTQGGGGGLTVHVVDGCATAASGVIVAVHNPNGSVGSTFTTGASGDVDLSAFGNPLTFTVGWPNSAGVQDASIQSFVDVPGNLGTFTVAVEGGSCPPNDPLQGTATVNLNPDPFFSNVDPLGTWLTSARTLDVHQSDLQTDGKLSLLAANFTGSPGPVNYGFLTDQTYAPGATYNINVNQVSVDMPVNSPDNLSFVFVSGIRKGVPYTLGQGIPASPTTSLNVPVYTNFPVNSGLLTASAVYLASGGIPYSTASWTRYVNSVPASLNVPALFHFTNFTYVAGTQMASWTVSDATAGKLAMLGFSNVQNIPLDDRHWTIVLDPTFYTAWFHGSLALPVELDITGRTVQPPSILGSAFSYIGSYSNALKALYAGGVVPPAPPYDMTVAFYYIP